MNPIQVNYKYTSNFLEAQQWLSELPDTIACDFEVAVKYTDDELQQFKYLLDHSSDKHTRITMQSRLNATPLGHPSHCTLTHLSIAWSESDALVLVLTNKNITNVALRFLTTTDRKQVWHNAGYDFRMLYYFTGVFPSNYEDTQILMKTINNHVHTHKANTGLKQTMGHYYGQWGISSDNFTLNQIRDEGVIKYAAIDAAATFKLWVDLNQFINESDKE